MRYFWELSASEVGKIRQQVKLALQQGILIPKGCEHEGCNVAMGLNIIAHHEDYDKPLDVTWLCKSHHRFRHAEINKLKPKRNKPKDRSVIDTTGFTIKPWADDYKDKGKPEKFMAHFPDCCYCKPCTLARKEKAWSKA